MANLAEMKAENIELEINVPGTEQDVGLRLELRSLDAPELEDVLFEIQEERQALLSEAGVDRLSKDQSERLNRKLYAAAIAAWHWHSGLNWNGVELELNQANAEMVLENRQIYLQVVSRYGDQKDFFASFAESLKTTSAIASDTMFPDMTARPEHSETSSEDTLSHTSSRQEEALG